MCVNQSITQLEVCWNLHIIQPISRAIKDLGKGINAAAYTENAVTLGEIRSGMLMAVVPPGYYNQQERAQEYKVLNLKAGYLCN